LRGEIFAPECSILCADHRCILFFHQACYKDKKNWFLSGLKRCAQRNVSVTPGWKLAEKKWKNRFSNVFWLKNALFQTSVFFNNMAWFCVLGGFRIRGTRCAGSLISNF
jgi:hypothetical protein